MLLAGMYALRVVVGGVATGVRVSEWLVAVSMFLFTSLAFAKRHAELARLLEENENSTLGRGYQVDDLSLIEVVGPASGYLAVLVLASTSAAKMKQCDRCTHTRGHCGLSVRFFYIGLRAFGFS